MFVYYYVKWLQEHFSCNNCRNGSRHYNQQDFMDAGALFARGVLQYSKVIEDQS